MTCKGPFTVMFVTHDLTHWEPWGKKIQKHISYERAYKRCFHNIHFSTGKQEPEVCLPPGLVLVHKQEIILSIIFAPLMRPVYFPQLTDVIRFPSLWAFLLCIPALQQLRAQAISAISTHTSHSATPQNYSAADWSEAKSGASSLGDLTLSRPQPAHLQSLCLFNFFLRIFLYLFSLSLFLRLRNTVIFAVVCA